MPFPESGDVVWYRSETPPRIARLTLRAPANTQKNFVVRLEDWSTGAPLALIPVRHGETSVTLVPLGRYRMTLSKGTNWSGPGRMFGASGESREALDPIEFYKTTRQTVGLAIDLEVQFSGNLPTRPVLPR